MRRAHVYRLLSVAIVTAASLGALTAFAALVVRDPAAALIDYLPGEDGSPQNLPTPAPVRGLELEDILREDITTFLKNPGAVLEQLETRLKAEIKKETDTEAKFADAAEAMASKQKERERVLGPYREGLIGDQEIEQQLRDLEEEIEALKGDQERLFGKRKALTQLRTRTINAETLLKSLRKKLNKADENTKRELIEALVDRIVVDTKGEGSLRRAELTITYLFDKPPPDPSKKKPDYYRRAPTQLWATPVGLGAIIERAMLPSVPGGCTSTTVRHHHI